jgi:hypothetical protein
VTTQEQMLEQMYGILDDWKAQQFGGAPIVEAIERTAVSTSATNQELKHAVEGLKDLAEVLHQQQVSAPATAASAPSDEARKEIRDNVHRLFVRMGRRLGTGDEPLEIQDPELVVLSRRNWILPVPLRGGGDAAIYGGGLDNVHGIIIDGKPATIGRILPGEVEFAVPADVRTDKVDVRIELKKGLSALEFEVPAIGVQTTIQTASRKGVKS